MPGRGRDREPLAGLIRFLWSFWGPMEVAALHREAISAGLAWATVQRAADHLQIHRSRRTQDSPWLWQLPATS